MRPIDADRFRADVQSWENCPNGFSDTYDKARIIDAIDEQPTIEAEPVRHGHWVNAVGENVPFDENIKGDPYCPCGSVWCSECGAWLTASDEYFATGRYCPNCGAKMEEQE